MQLNKLPQPNVLMESFIHDTIGQPVDGVTRQVESLPTPDTLIDRFIENGSLGKQAKHDQIDKNEAVTLGAHLKNNFAQLKQLDNSPSDKDPTPGSIDLSPDSGPEILIKYTGTPEKGEVTIEQSDQEFEVHTKVKYAPKYIRQVMVSEVEDKEKYNPDLAAAAFHVDLEKPENSYQEYIVFNA